MSKLLQAIVASANNPDGNFPLNNLPFGVFSIDGTAARCCSALGDFVIDLAILEETGLFDLPAEHVFNQPALNSFMELGETAWTSVRNQLQELLGADAMLDDLPAGALVPIENVMMHLPFKVAEFTDFYASKNHATNVGTMLRGAENALSPNWLHMPIGYNGRASTVVVSGTDIVRPCGQLKGPDFDAPIFAPSRRLDIELEMGAVVGQPSKMGQRLTVEEADAMIFGYVLLNDWSARDIQAFEYQPLGPFQAKAFATSISPWVVTHAALEMFRVSTPTREVPLLPYLEEPRPLLYDIDLAVDIQPEGGTRDTISRTNYREMYYSAAQQLAHHSSSGCAMRVGDLLGSGTISGPDRTSCGSLLEMSWGGKEPLILSDGETRSFIEDGDTLTLSGFAQGDSYRIGFGECAGTILPAKI